MTAQASYGIDINVNTSQAIANVKGLDAAFKQLAHGNAANDNLGGVFDKVSKGAGKAASETGKIGAVLDDIKGRAAGAIPGVGNLLSKLIAFGPQAAILGAVAIAIVGIGSAAVQAAAKVETWKANLLTMTKNTQQADSAYRALVEFAGKTPFDLKQSVEGFTKLRALGLETSTAIMTSYGNTASAMGKDMSQIIEAVADATTGEFERLKEFGIKASQEGNKVKFTFQGVTTTVDKNSKAIQKYIVDIGNKNFGGAMARQAATAAGAFSQLEDQIFNTLAAMGDGTLNKTIGKITNGISAGLSAITPLLSGIMDLVGGILSAAVDIGAGLVSAFTGGTQGASNLKTGMDNLALVFAVVGESVSIVGKVIGSVFRFIGDVTGMVTGLISDQFAAVFGWLMPATESTGQSMGQSFVGILRAAGYVAGQLPNIFGLALAELKDMFSAAGSALAASLTGDFSKWKGVDISFGRTQKLVGTVMKNAIKIHGNQKANQAWIDEKRGVASKGSIDFAALGNDKNKPDKKKGKTGKSDAEKRIEDEKEFWKTLKDQAATAALLPLAAEDYSKQLELQKILGRNLNADEKARVNTANQLVRTNKFLTDAMDGHNKKSLELGQQESLFAAQLKGMTEDQASVEKEVYAFRNNALAQGVDLQSAAYQAAEAAARADAVRGAQLAKNNALLSEGNDLFSQYTKAGQLGAISKKYDDQRSAAATAYGNGQGKYSADDYRKVLSGIAKDEARAKQELDDQLRFKAYDKWTGVIDGLADVFGGAFGKLANTFADLVGSLKGESGIGGLMKSIGLGDAFKGGLDKMFGKGSVFMKEGLGKTFNGLFGKNGTLVKGLGDKLGAMGAGAQVGQTVAAFGKMISSKFSSTGSMIGGAIGQFAGPLGSIAGSIIGGVLGGMLKKAKWGTASVTNGSVSVAGNKTAYKDNASTAANSITSGLDSIAEQLGAEANGNYSVSIGQYKGKWRVSSNGRTGKLKGKYSDVTDFGKDGAEEALQFALADAIRDGALTGLRASTQALLAAGDDLEAQLTKALKFEGVFKELKSRIDPVGSAIDTLNTEFKSLVKVFQEAGASSEEYAQLEQLRALKLQDIIKQQTSSFQSILDTLNGSAGGFSSMSTLNKNLAAMEVFKSDIAAGKSVDQDSFSTLMDSIINGVNDIYGANSAAGQNILGDVRKTTTDAMALVTNQINSLSATDTVSAIQQQTTAYSTAQQETNSWLKNIYGALTAKGSSAFASVATAAQSGNVNGKVVMAY